MMKLSRPSRFVAALVTLFSLLFTQLAVAAYACPAQGSAPMAMSAAMGNGDMAGCQGMDQHALCAAHCDPGHQSLDTPGSPHVQPFVPAALAVVLAAGATLQPVMARRDPYRLTRTTAPPLAIRNCCFRI